MNEFQSVKFHKLLILALLYIYRITDIKFNIPNLCFSRPRPGGDRARQPGEHHAAGDQGGHRLQPQVRPPARVGPHPAAALLHRPRARPPPRPQAQEGADRTQEGALGHPAVRREAPPGGGRHHGQRQGPAYSQVRLQDYPHSRDRIICLYRVFGSWCPNFDPGYLL